MNQQKDSPYLETSKDRLLAAEAGLLSAVLQIHGFMIAAMAIIVAIRPTIPSKFFIAVIISSILGLVLIIYNLHIIRGFYQAHAAYLVAGYEAAAKNQPDSDLQKEKNELIKQQSRGRNNQRREY